MRSRNLRKIGKLSGLVAVCASAIAMLAPGSAAASSFPTGGAVSFAVDGPSSAIQYPSTIAVDGLPGTVEKVRVTLNQVQQFNAEDLDLVLVSPAGTPVILMADACAVVEFNNAPTVTFDDAAAAPLDVSNCPPGGGTFKPTDIFPGGADNFPAPGPGLVFGPTSLAAYIGSSPNGAWRLFARDDNGGFALDQIFSSWTLHIDLKTRCSGRFVTDAGTAGDDVIQGTSDIDVIAGFAGNDTIRGLGEEDVILRRPRQGQAVRRRRQGPPERRGRQGQARRRRRFARHLQRRRRQGHRPLLRAREEDLTI